jgi:hypothetical protein
MSLATHLASDHTGGQPRGWDILHLKTELLFETAGKGAASRTAEDMPSQCSVQQHANASQQRATTGSPLSCHARNTQPLLQKAVQDTHMWLYNLQATMHSRGLTPNTHMQKVQHHSCQKDQGGKDTHGKGLCGTHH